MYLIVYGFFILMGISALISGVETLRTGVYRHRKREHIFRRPVTKTISGQSTYVIGVANILTGIICLITSVYMIVMQDDNWFGFGLIVGFTAVFIQLAGYYLSLLNRRLRADENHQGDTE